jgi:RNA polymerase sigma-70 factor (ECF subfamily)
VHDSPLKASTSDAPATASAEERAQAVAHLFEAHNRALISFLTLRLHSFQDAKEVAQEAYVRLLELDRTGAVSFMRAYLFRIAANLAVDRVRRQIVRRKAAEEEQHFLDDVDEAAAPERTCIAREELEEIGRRLQSLPPKCQQAFVMHAMLERPVKEIAEEMKLTERMVRYYLVRGFAVCREVEGQREAVAGGKGS